MTISKCGSTYQIAVFCGYDECGFEIVKTKPYNPRRGTSQKRIEAELAQIAATFEKKCRQEQAATTEKHNNITGFA